MKIGSITVDCIFIGYAHSCTAYRFLIQESNIPDIHKNTIMESRNGSLFEYAFHVNLKKSQAHRNECLRLLMKIVKI